MSTVETRLPSDIRFPSQNELIEDRRRMVKLLTEAINPEAIQAALDQIFGEHLTSIGGGELMPADLELAKDILLKNSLRDFQKWGVTE